MEGAWNVAGTAASCDPKFLVVFLSEDWDCPPAGFTRRDMLLAVHRKLAKQGWRVLAIERPICPIVTLLRQPGKLMQALIGRRRLRLIEERFYLATPKLAIHERAAARCRVLERINGWLMRRQIRSWLARLEPGSLPKKGPSRPDMMWIFHPCQSWLIEAVPHDALIYECYDEYPALVRSRKHKMWLKREEARILASADLVITTSLELFKSRRPLNANTILVNNGVDFELFSNGESFPEPDDLAPIRRPRICYAGAINQRLDWELLHTLAEANADWSLVMIGPVDRSAEADRLRILPNVHFLKARPREQIPAYLAHCDVNIIPYARNRCTSATYPLKLNEYLAVGRPVVSTSFGPDLEEFRDVVHLAHSRFAFCSAVLAALGESGRDYKARARSVARRNSWECRAEEIAASILARGSTMTNEFEEAICA